MKKLMIAVLLIVVLILFMGSAAAKEINKDFHETFDVQKGDVLHLTHGDGNVNLIPWDKDKIDVEVHCVPRRAQANGVRCPHAGNTSKPASLGQMMETQETVMKHVRHAWPVPIQGQRANRQAVAEANVYVAPSCISDDLMGELDKRSAEPLVYGRRQQDIRKRKRKLDGPFLGVTAAAC